MERNKRRTPKKKFCNFLSRNRTGTDLKYMLPFGGTKRVSDCYVDCVTVQHIEYTDSL